MADLFFSKGLLEQFVLHAQFGKHLLEPSVLVFNGFHLRDHGCIHPAILRPPLVKQRGTHAMFAAQLGHRHTAFGLAQDRNNLRLRKSAGLHVNLLVLLCRENSTFKSHYFRGDYPLALGAAADVKESFHFDGTMKKPRLLVRDGV